MVYSRLTFYLSIYYKLNIDPILRGTRLALAALPRDQVKNK